MIFWHSYLVHQPFESQGPTSVRKRGVGPYGPTYCDCELLEISPCNRLILTSSGSFLIIMLNSFVHFRGLTVHAYDVNKSNMGGVLSSIAVFQMLAWALQWHSADQWYSRLLVIHICISIEPKNAEEQFKLLWYMEEIIYRGIFRIHAHPMGDNC